MFCHLIVKSNYSLLVGLSSIESIVLRAKQLGYTSIALTDENVIYGYDEFRLECQKHNIKPIYGIELDYYVNGEKYGLVLLAQNNKGYHNILKLSSRVMTGKTVDHKVLKEYREGIICLTPGYQKGYIEQSVLKNDYELAVNEINVLKSIYNSFFISYSNHFLEIEKELLLNLKKLCALQKINMVLTNNVLYTHKSDSPFYPYLNAIKMGNILKGDIDFNEHFYLKSGKEMLMIDSGDLFYNAEKIASVCNVELTHYKNLIPKYKSYSYYDSFTFLKGLCQKGIQKRYGKELNESHISRLNYELKVINDMGYSDYFLIVYDYIKYAKTNNIIVGPGRGSACGSIVSYCLGITNVDPIKYGLLFERFLNPERISMPDIDVDFQDNRRDEVINYVKKKYGVDKVAQIVTFATFGAKQSIRDVGKVLDIPSGVIDKISKTVPNSANISLEEAYRTSSKFRDLINSSNLYKKMLKIASKIEGNPKHSSIHAAGIVLSENPLDEVIGVQSSNDESILCTQTSMNYLESLGLLKMDFLGLRNLTIIDKIVEDVKNGLGIDLDLNDIDLNDKPTLDIFKAGDTNGIFQFESEGMKKVLRNLRPESFKDIYAANALFRPGPMEFIEEFTLRRHGKKKVTYIVESLKSILEDTYGIIVYQEQILEIAKIMAGYSLGMADILRKAMGKKDEDILLKEKENFINGCLKNGYSKDEAIEVYNLIFKFANYGFSKAHSVAYSIVGYQLAYLKANYSQYFFSAMLSSLKRSSYSIQLFKKECKKYNIIVEPPSVLLSEYDFKVLNNSIIFALGSIKGISLNVVNELIKVRKKRDFNNFSDFVISCYSKVINKQILSKLIKASAFDCFGLTKRTMIENLDSLISYAELVSTSTEGQSKFDFSFIPKPKIKEYKEYPKDELLAFELEVYDFYLEAHPVDEYKKGKNLPNSLDVKNHLHKNINLILYVNMVKEIKTKNNRLMAFVKTSDEAGDVELTLFPKVYSTLRGNIKGRVIEVSGQVDDRNNSLSVLVNNLKVL